MLVLPTFSFCILLGQAGFPITLSRMVAYKDKSIPSLYFTVFLFLLLFNILISIILIILAPTLSHSFLKNEAAYLPLIGIAFVIPFTTCSNILRSYFIGIQKVFPTVLSNVIENLLRLFFILWIIPRLKIYTISILVFSIILFNIISETISTMTLLLFIPKKKKKISFQYSYLKETIQTSYPQLLSTLIGNGTYFLEPLIIFHFLTKEYKASLITQQYGIITGYVFPLIFLPLFFITAISQVLLPTITKFYKDGQLKKITKLLKIETFCIFLFSIGTGLFFRFFSKDLLQLLYHTSYGINYLKYISIFLFFIYLEPVFQYLWIAFGKTKEIMLATTFSSLIRITSLVLLLKCHFGIDSLLLSLTINLIATTFFEYERIFLIFKKKRSNPLLKT